MGSGLAHSYTIESWATDRDRPAAGTWVHHPTWLGSKVTRDGFPRLAGNLICLEIIILESSRKHSRLVDDKAYSTIKATWALSGKDRIGIFDSLKLVSYLARFLN